jgi:hypothetical protein
LSFFKKVAVMSGDLRKALDLLRRAIGLAVRMDFCLAMVGHEEAVFSFLFALGAINKKYLKNTKKN